MKVDVCMKCRKFKCYDPVTKEMWCPRCDPLFEHEWRKQREQLRVPGETTVWAKIGFCIVLIIAMIVGYVFWIVLP